MTTKTKLERQEEKGEEEDQVEVHERKTKAF